MKKIIILLVFISISIKTIAQSSTIAPNYIVIPGMATLPACSSTGKGRTVFNTTDNKMYFCDGSAWQSMAGVPSAGVGWSQSGTDISNTNAGNVGIGTNSPSSPLTVKAPFVGYSQENMDASTQFHIKLGGNFAQLRTTTASGISLSAGKLLPDLSIDYPSGNVGIGGIFGSEKLHVNGNIKVNEGFYSASTGGLNMVPLGVISVNYRINTNVDLLDLSIVNKAGNLATGTYSYVKINSIDDVSHLGVNLNSTLLSTYSQVVLVGSPNFAQYGPYINVSRAIYLYISGVPVLYISLGSDDFTSCEVSGDYIIYGIK
jgi:hypothetical protein